MWGNACIHGHMAHVRTWQQPGRQAGHRAARRPTTTHVLPMHIFVAAQFICTHTHIYSPNKHQHYKAGPSRAWLWLCAPACPPLGLRGLFLCPSACTVDFTRAFPLSMCLYGGLHAKAKGSPNEGGGHPGFGWLGWQKLNLDHVFWLAGMAK